MTLNLKLANGISHFQKALTPAQHFIRKSRCVSRFAHDYSRNRPPSNQNSQPSKASSAPFRAKHGEKSSWRIRPSQLPDDNSELIPSKKVYVAPEVVLFHNPASKLSLRAKKVLESAQISFPKTKMKIGTPLPLKLTVHERLPTVDEINDIYLCLEEQSWTKFLTLPSSAYRTHSTNAVSVLEIIQQYRERRLLQAQEGQPSQEGSAEEIKEVVEDDPSDDLFAGLEPVTLPPTHPLFGTECFAWPIVVWDSKFALVAPSWKSVGKRLYKYARLRDGILSPEERQIAKEEAKERALKERAEARLRFKEVSPDEGDTLRWYNESSRPKSRSNYREDREQ